MNFHLTIALKISSSNVKFVLGSGNLESTICIEKIVQLQSAHIFSRWGNTRTRMPTAQEEDNSFIAINYERSSNYCIENFKFKCELCAGVRQSGVNYLH